MKVFTTGQVAKICKVAPRTVSKWFDSGRLKGYRIPGSQDRRIPREYLIKFLKEHGMPLGDLEDEAMAKVLIVAQDQVLTENLKRELPMERSFKVAVAASGFDAGIQAESFHPDCIIVDFSIGRTEALQICQNLRRNSEFTEVILIALLPTTEALPASIVRASTKRSGSHSTRHCSPSGFARSLERKRNSSDRSRDPTWFRPTCYKGRLRNSFTFVLVPLVGRTQRVGGRPEKLLLSRSIIFRALHCQCSMG